MIRLALALSLLLAVACDKSGSPAGEAEAASAADEVAEAAPVAAKGAAEPTAVEPEAAEAESCGEGEDCGGGCDQWDEAAAEIAKRDAPADAEWTTVAVSGMTCGGCERRVIANLGELEGVLAVEADAELGQVRVAMAKGAGADAAVAKIRELGYTVQ